MNIGFEDDDLKPFIEPTKEFNDPARIGKTTTCLNVFLCSFITTETSLPGCATGVVYISILTLGFVH